MTAARKYHQVFRGQPDEVAQVRREVGQHVQGTPVADDVVLIVSELASNAVVHSKSQNEIFVVSCEVYTHCVRVEVADLGGQWHDPEPDDRPHGLDIVRALSATWGTTHGTGGIRVVWARVEFQGAS
jgi:serine/threonine-protein kinase RsbW